MIKGVTYLITVALLVLASSLVSAYDPSPLQDFYVAINNTNSAGIYVHTLIIICSSSNFHQVHLKSLEVLHINEIMPSIKKKKN